MTSSRQVVVHDTDADGITSIFNACFENILKVVGIGTPKEELLSRHQAAEFLHVTLPTLHTLSLAGTIKAYRLGKKVLYKKTELLSSLKPFNLGR